MSSRMSCTRHIRSLSLGTRLISCGIWKFNHAGPCLSPSYPSAIINLRLWLLDSSHTYISGLITSLSYFRYTLSSNFVSSLSIDPNSLRVFRNISEKSFDRDNFVLFSIFALLRSSIFSLRSKSKSKSQVATFQVLFSPSDAYVEC